MATDAQKKLQELIEDVRGSDSKLTVSGVKKFDDANKLKLGLFQQGLTSIKDQDPSVEARRKANFSIGNLVMYLFPCSSILTELKVCPDSFLPVDVSISFSST